MRVPRQGMPPEQRLSDSERRFDARRRSLGLVLGPLAFLILLLLPPPALPLAAARLAAILAWVVIWWITEPVPIPITALLGPSLAVVLGVGTAREIFAPFGDPVIFLFLGSFILAEAMSLHGLDRRLALAIVTRVGTSPTRVLLAFTALAAMLSMWLSNTATTAMLYPIALGVLGTLGPAGGDRRAAGALLLACAYGASIGGIGTPVGSPPNLIALGQLAALAGVQLSFVQWMVLSGPAAILLLAVAAVYLSRTCRLGATRASALAALVEERRRRGRWQAGERNVVIAFSGAVALWLAPGVLGLLLGNDSAVSQRVAAMLPESTVALLAATSLFVLPVDWKDRRFTLAWPDAVRIDWGTLLLFGGGLSLGAAMFRTGLAATLGDGLTRSTGASSVVALTFLFTVFAIYFTEITSNTATATMLVPLAIAAAQAVGVSPVAPALGCALGCSMAFMLPVATPPNAIVYGSGLVPITRMVRTGFWLNLAAALLVPPSILLSCHLLGL